MIGSLLVVQAYSQHPKDIDEARSCMVFVTNYNTKGEAQSHGTGTIIEEGGKQWIYTNAHVIEGAHRIEFKDIEGLKIDGFGRFQCFAEGSGAGELAIGKARLKFGSDAVRIELLKKRDLAFEIAEGAPDKSWSGMPVITLGDNGGNKNLNILEGTITAIGSGIVQSNCKTEPGCSGGALIKKDGLQIIGLHTWGIDSKMDIKDAIWQEIQTDPKLAGASVLHGNRWIETKPADFINGSFEAMKFRDTVRMLFLIYSLTPQERGFKFDSRSKLAANITFEQAFDRYENIPVLRPVIELNKRIAARSENLSINNMELVKIYARAISDIRNTYLKERTEIQSKLAPYFRLQLEQSGFFEVGDWCHEGLSDAESWFDSRARLGGTMPVGKWFNLKPLSELGKER